MSDVVAMIHVKCEQQEIVNRKWQNQQEIGLCLQLCRWSPLGPAWRLFNMTHFNSTWGARSWLHTHTTQTCEHADTHAHTHTHAWLQTHTHPCILRVIHLKLDIPAAFWKNITSFQILKGDMFLIIDIQVRISIWCCLTPQTWVAVGWAGRRARV